MTEIVQESEMAAIRQIFERAANAIVQASELSVQVKELSDKVQHLVQDIEYAQSKNRELDTMLHDTREQRDHAKAELSVAGNKLDEQERAINTLTQTNDIQLRQLGELNQELAKAKDEAKGWEQAAVKADQEAQEANAKLDAIHKTLGIAPATVQATPEPHKPVEQTKPVAVVTEDDPGFDWNRPYHYDMDRKRHVQD